MITIIIIFLDGQHLMQIKSCRPVVAVIPVYAHCCPE